LPVVRGKRKLVFKFRDVEIAAKARGFAKFERIRLCLKGFDKERRPSYSGIRLNLSTSIKFLFKLRYKERKDE